MTRRKKRSPRRAKGPGLLLVLTLAVLLGAVLGTLWGRYAPLPGSTGSGSGQGTAYAPPSPPQSASTPAQRHRSRASATVEPSATPEPANQARKPAVNLSRPSVLAGEFACAAGGNRVALTLDAGASSEPTPAVLAALKAARLKVTFFLTGKWCERNESLVRAIHDDGHEIANHTYSHPDLRKLSDEEIRDQLGKTNDIVKRLTGEPCAPYFRPPLGARDKRVLSVAGEAGYTSVYWSLDSWDAFKKDITSEEIKDRVLERIKGGDVILMHCGSRASAEALPDLIRQIKARGYTIVKVSELRALE